MRLSNVAAVAALASNALALNVNRLDGKWVRGADSPPKRIHWVTVYNTVTVYAGSKTAAPEPHYQEAVPTPEAVAPEAPAQENSNAAVDDQYVESPYVESPYDDDDDDDKSGGGGGGGSYPELSTKRGFAYNDASLVNTLLRSGTQGSWAYNWDSLANGLSSDVEFVPMLWSDRSDHLDRWPANIEASLAAGSTHILSFNEPDHKAQANLSPAHAAAAHARHLNPYGSRARIGAPAVTNSNLAGEGTRWLAEFVPACEAAGCQIDFCVAHWYSPHDADDSLIDHLHEVHELCGGDKPVWLTEFAALGDDTQNAAFLDRTLKRLDEIPWLERYSYFMVSEGKMISSGSSLSAQGKAFFRVGS